MHETQTNTIRIQIDGESVDVCPGSTVVVALTIADKACRLSVHRQERGPLCAMGICFECRVTIDGIPKRLACQTLCKPHMDVRTDA